MKEILGESKLIEQEPRPFTISFLIPGQGSQAEGMGKDLFDHFPQVRPIFYQAEDALGIPVLQLCRTGTKYDLKKTENAQALIGTVCLAAYAAAKDVLEQNGFPTNASIGAGISFGELAHNAIAGAYTIEDYFKIIKNRGRIMEQVGKGKGAMKSVLGMQDRDSVLAICRKTGVVPAIWYPKIAVISGSHEQLAEAVAEFGQAGGRVFDTGVEYPFHNPIMQDAKTLFSELLGDIKFYDTKYPIVMNSTGEVTTSGALIREKLPDQITQTVDGELVLRRLREKTDIIIEFCPQPTLSRIIKRAHPKVSIMSIYSPDSLQEVVAHLREQAKNRISLLSR